MTIEENVEKSGVAPETVSQGFAASATLEVQAAVTPSASLANGGSDSGSASSAPTISQGFAASSTERVPSTEHLQAASPGEGPSGAALVGEPGVPKSIDGQSPESSSSSGKDAPQEGIFAVEKYAVGLILIAMGILPTLEAVSRLTLNIGIPGALTHTQNLTLWIGFLGALLATGSGKHLCLAIGEFFHGPLKTISEIYAGLLSTVVCGALTYASVVMVSLDAQTPKILPGGIPEWVSEAIMPVTLFLMTARFAFKSAKTLRGRIPAMVAFLLVTVLCLLELHSSELLTLPLASEADRSFVILEWLENHADVFVLPGAILILMGIVLGSPLFIGMSGLAMLFFFGESTPVASVPSETYRLVQNAALPAIPVLTAAGYVLAEGGASKRLLRVAKSLVGWLPGGLALMVVAVLAGFTTFTGGSGVTILALGGLVMPMLIKEKYPEGFSLGLVTSSGSLGLLFPPSLPVILYSVVAGVGMNDLFIAGLIPGGLLILLVAAMGVFMGVKCQAPRQSFSLKEAALAIWEAKWELFIPLVVLLAIFTGFATLVEAAAIAFLAAILAECIVFKDLSLTKDLPDTLARAGTLVGAVVILMGVAMGLTSYMVDAEIPARALEWTQGHIDSPWVFLLALNAVLLVLGSVLEIYSAIVILAPLLVPMASAYGIDPIHLGVVFLANLELGFLFPPVGLNLILSSTRFGQPLTRLYKVAFPFLLIMAVGVLLTTYLPILTTGFLNFVKG